MPGNGKTSCGILAGGDTLSRCRRGAVLDPVLAALFIRAGAVGGVVTPRCPPGVAMGALVALAVNRLGGEASVSDAGADRWRGSFRGHPKCSGVRRGSPPTDASAVGGVGNAAVGRGRRTRRARRRHDRALASRDRRGSIPSVSARGISPPAMTCRVMAWRGEQLLDIIIVGRVECT